MSTLPQSLEYAGGRLTLCEAEAGNAAAVLAHVAVVAAESDFLSMAPGEFELTEVQGRAFLHATREAAGQLYLLAEVNGGLGGTLSFAAGRRSRVRHVGEFGMSVRRSHWGRGVGSALLTTLLGWAAGTGTVRKLTLRVRTDNARAIARYRRHGFEVEGTLRDEPYVGGVYHDLHWVGRRV